MSVSFATLTSRAIRKATHVNLDLWEARRRRARLADVAAQTGQHAHNRRRTDRIIEIRNHTGWSTWDAIQWAVRH